ncbi:MAG TPA: trypsin-like peptidase domain-containing protein, partial [Pirellulaceae bacterium]|nr:trypsin-like peptidase domain-containing protein [Pirellulaceae bacterium]
IESPATDDQATAADYPELKTPPTEGGSVVVNKDSVRVTPPTRRAHGFTPVPTPPPPPPVAGSSSAGGPGAGAGNSSPGVTAPAGFGAGVSRPDASSVRTDASDSTAAGADGSSVSVVARSTGRTASSRAGGRGKSTSPIVWVIGGGLAALAISIGVLVAVVTHFSKTNPQVNPVSKRPVLVLDWPVEERKGAALDLNGKRQTIASDGPLELMLEEGTHRLTIRRRGYEQIDYSFSVRKGDRFPFRPDWKSLAGVDPATPGGGATGGSSGTGVAGSGGGSSSGVGGGGGSVKPSTPGGDFPVAPLNFGGWLQSFEVAQRRATEKKKDIFIVFSGSDWSPLSIKMATEIFSNERFRQFAELRFELVVIDLPRTEAGFNLLEDVNQNRNLIRRFGVRSVPTVVLTDSAGLPYAADGVFNESADKYIQHITLLAAKHNTRDARLGAVEAARNRPPADRLAAAEQAVAWLQQEKLQSYYGRFISQCLVLARQIDSTNEQGKLEVFFEADWLVRLNLSLIDQKADAMVGVLSDLRQWSDTHRFVDPDRAARMHLAAAALLRQPLDRPDESLQHLALAKTYMPRDPALKKDLESLERAIKSRDQLSSGTGFVVSTDGHVLTNNHVIEGPGRVVVRLPGSTDSTPAEVVARDAARDIALLKVDPAQFPRSTPLAITAAKVNRAASVAVFGFPLGDDIASDVRISTGVVSSLPEQSENGMLLLDCRINPGNSGGPVMNRSGQVVGMVTAKTSGGFGLDSYGMALPSKDLLAFLMQNLPNYRPNTTGDSNEVREWEQIDQAIQASVLMVLKVR